MNSAKANIPERVYWLDYARGIGIILVVLAHVIRGLRVELVGSRLNDYLLLDALIYSFHMPLFFFVSGVLFERRLLLSWQSFLRSLAIGIAVPYVLWTTALVSLQNVAPSEVNHLYSFKVLPDIWYRPVGYMWFLYALLIVQIVFFVGVRLLGLWSVVVFGCAFASFFCVPSLSPLTPGVTMGGTFVALGIITAAWQLLPKSRAQMWTTFALMGMLWLGSEFALLNRLAPQALVPFAAVFGVAMTIAACLLIPQVKDAITTTLAQFGQASIAIFVAHPIFEAGWRIMLYRVGIFEIHTHVWSGTLVGLFVPTALFLLANRFKISPYVGFGRNQQALYFGRYMRSDR